MKSAAVLYILLKWTCTPLSHHHSSVIKVSGSWQAQGDCVVLGKLFWTANYSNYAEKQNKTKQAGDAAQLVLHWPSMHKALGLVPSTEKIQCGGPPLSYLGVRSSKGRPLPLSEFKTRLWNRRSSLKKQTPKMQFRANRPLCKDHWRGCTVTQQARGSPGFCIRHRG